MRPLRRLGSVTLALVRAGLVLILIALVVLGVALAVVESGWAKNQIRALIVRQANQYLTASLEIGRLEGSLVRGLELGDVTLSQNGRPIIAIDSVALSYSLRELWQNGTVIRRVRVTRPRVVVARQSDGRWNLGALVKRDAREQERTGPGRPIEIQAIEVVDASVSLTDPLQFGAAHIPTEFRSLNASMSFAYAPVRWTLVFGSLSWVGHAPELTVTRLSGKFGRGPDGWFFDGLSVQTPRSAFTMSGEVLKGEQPTALDLSVRADRFAFQEWSGVLSGLKNIAIEAAFTTTLKGPLTRLDTHLTLAGNGGSVAGQLTLDTTVPGWHGAGAVDLMRLNLARWLNRPDRASDVTGHVSFNLDLDLGGHFPRGTYAFDGPHAMYMDYAAGNLRARGRLTATEVVIDSATALAYRANLTATTGSIGIDHPFPFHFQGSMGGLDLRFVPATVPVPRVESTLAFDYDVSGRFSMPFITGRAQFARSAFLGATIGAGTVGTIDTETRPIRYSGDGDVQGLDLHRLGEGLQIVWLQDSRYAGLVSGHFHVQGAGADRESLTLTAGGRLARADLFHGTVSDADLTLAIDRGTLRTSFAGRFAGVDPAIPFAEPRFSASLDGSADVRVTVRDFLTRTPALADYDVAGRMTLGRSSVRGIALDTAAIDGTLANERLSLARLDVSGQAIAGTGSGILAFNPNDTSDFQYNVTRADLGALQAITGGSVKGLAITKGRVSGPTNALRAAGDGSFSNLDAFGISALTMTGQYDVTIPVSNGGAPSSARVTGRGSFLTAFGQTVQDASGTVTLEADRADFDLTLTQAPARTGRIAGALLIGPDRHSVTLLALTVAAGSMPWRLVQTAGPPELSWSAAGIAITPATLVTGTNGDERIDVAGTWRYDGSGGLHVTATHVFLETLANAQERPARYGGVVDLDATIRGTRSAPFATGTITVTDGRVDRVTYQKLAGRVDYAQGLFDIDVRLDQSPGTWLTAKGTVPLGLFKPDAPERAIDVAIMSSPIDFGLVGGVTDLIRRTSGELRLNVRAIGTTRDPHFEGTIDLANTAFQVVASGVGYKNGRAALRLTADRVTVESLHIEDEHGRSLDVQGSLGTHELRVGDLEIDATARGFEVLHNELGTVDIDAMLRLRGRFEAPRLAGTITINGDTLRVDQILERTLFQPYATAPAAMPAVDAVAALNPWSRLGLDLFLRVPNRLRLTGTNIQVASGTPIGLGDINLRVGGDLYLYKDPGQPISITGSLDQVSGTYTFQGRRFAIDEAHSSINFVGDLDPNLFVTVTRIISAVEARVTISGSLHEPELHLSSVPPLDESDILSLIVFNTTPNALTAAQQQELAVRAGTLAAGFLATPLLTAIRNDLGLEAFEIEPAADLGTGPKVTIAEELAPGLVARFSRQFGQQPFDEATIEYYLSRLLRLRATFSDAPSLTPGSPFRRVERAGIDLLVFLSF